MKKDPFPSGYFSQLDTIHVHVDSGADSELVKTISDSLNEEGADTKENSVREFIAGPQRGDPVMAETYNSHTPKMNGREKLEFFTTTLFGDWDKTVARLHKLLTTLRDKPGVVVEVERVMGVIEEGTNWSSLPLKRFPLIRPHDVGFERATTFPIEIHYCLDIAKESAQPPLTLSDLLETCRKLGIAVGGWFQFDKGNKWAFRSNSFAEASVSPEGIRQHRDALVAYVRERGLRCEVRVLVEQVLGVWRTPLKESPLSKQPTWLHELQELADWERSIKDLKEFWVIAPNFQGDKDPHIRKAMEYNLSRGVRYIYFLRSFADVRRLGQFAERLAEKINPSFVYHSIQAILLLKDGDLIHSENNPLNGDFFIANPRGKNPQGYTLIRSTTRNGEIAGGVETETHVIDWVVKKLKPLVREYLALQGLCIPIQAEARRNINRAVLYTKLDNVAEHRERLGNDNWERVLREYDLIVASEASKHSGEVAKSLGDGYVLIFRDASDALRCAEQLQKSAEEYRARVAGTAPQLTLPAQNIVLDSGGIYRALRAHGFDYVGLTLSFCEELVEKLSGGRVLMSDAFLRNARPGFGREEWDRRRLIELDEFETSWNDKYDVVELDWAAL